MTAGAMLGVALLERSDANDNKVTVEFVEPYPTWDWVWAEPTATAVPTMQSGGGRGGLLLPSLPNGASIEVLICSYAWPCATALRIAQCESRFQPDAIGTGSYGLMQIQADQHEDKLRAVTGRVVYIDLLDAHINLEVAWLVYVANGNTFLAWSCA